MTSHPELVSTQQDVVTDCLHDEDLSIRLQALDLETAIVTSGTIQSVVNTLLDQLRYSPTVPQSPANIGGVAENDLGETTGLHDQMTGNSEPLPSDYRVEVLHRILDICSHNNYSELPDFEWYVDVLVQLAALLPHGPGQQYPLLGAGTYFEEDISSRIGSEIRNIAVRVKSIRMEATRAAESLVLTERSAKAFPNTNTGVLGPIAWVIGEYAEFLAYPDRTIRSLTDMENGSLPTQSLSLYLQAIPKVLVYFTNHGISRDAPKKDEVLFLLERVIGFFEALSAHPDLDIQERSIEFLEILRLAAEALRSEDGRDIPLLLSTAIPDLFSGLELNPVSVKAQRKVPFPEKLVLDCALNGSLVELFDDSHLREREPRIEKVFYDYYYSPDPLEGPPSGTGSPAQLDMPQHVHGLSAEEEALAMARRKAERRERNRDDPFYIGAEDHAASRPFSHGFNASDSNDLDVDSIPIVDLTMNEGDQETLPAATLGHQNKKKYHPSRPKDTGIAADETIGDDYPFETPLSSENHAPPSRTIRPPLLQVDSSSLGQVSLDSENNESQNRMSGGGTADDVAMARAVQEVEKVRLEMQRESERIRLEGIPTEGAPIKKKKKGTTKRRSKKRERSGSKGDAAAS